MKIITHFNDEIIATGENALEFALNRYGLQEEEYEGEIVEFEGVLRKKEYVDKILAEREKQRIEQFHKDFFNTSLGWVRRKVYFAGTGETKDFLTGVLPILKDSIGQPILITYNEDGTQNLGVIVTTEFIAECEQQLKQDMYPQG